MAEKDRVLVVDDYEPELKILTIRLNAHAGFDAVGAASGEEALRMLESASFDIVLTDQRMPPGMDGTELARRVRTRYPEVPVVMITAAGSIEMTVEAMRAGAAHVLTKTAPFEELTAVLLRELAASEAARTRPPRLAPGSSGLLIGTSEVARRTDETISRYAQSPAAVLLLGETGTGKSLHARAIHDRSPRAGQPWVDFNCANFGDALLLAELFGTVRGAFTGATDKPGRVELAERGTLFLDEIGELSAEGQLRLLDLLQTKEFSRVGSTLKKKADIRIVAATNQRLQDRVREKHFREDLFFRLDKLTVELQPLSARLEDVPPLAEHVMVRLRVEYQNADAALTPAALTALTRHSWPGNVRELENFLERLLVTSTVFPIQEAEVLRALAERGEPTGAGGPIPMTGSLASRLRDYERAIIAATLKVTKGDRTQTARLLEVSRRTLFYKLREHKLS
jgi:DNA-binding NtrC family response regulator